MCLEEIVKSFKTFQPFAFPIWGISLGNMYVVIYESKKVLLYSKTNWCNRDYQVGVEKLVKPLCFLLLGLIVVFYSFYAFVIVVFDVVTFELFFEYWKI